MSQALRKLTATIKKTNCMVIFINQIRMKIGVMFGSPETTTGGNALKFYASVRLDIRRTGTIKKGEEAIGNETKVKVVKNKVAPPFKTAEFDILFGEGISREGEIIDMGVTARILEKSGAWYAYNGEKIGQGRDNAREFLRENRELAREIENKVRESLEIPLLPADVGRRSRIRPGRRHAAGSAVTQGPGLAPAQRPRALPRRAGAQAGKHEEEPGQLARVLDDLQAKGFIDEQRVVESVLHRRASRLGAGRIRQELQAKGLAGELVGEALQGLKAPSSRGRGTCGGASSKHRRGTRPSAASRRGSWRRGASAARSSTACWADRPTTSDWARLLPRRLTGPASA
jgi:SOS response regulatory protein OraA/RecX